MTSPKHAITALAVGLASLLALPVSAHFQVLVPQSTFIPGAQGSTVNLQLAFTHPMENGPVMEMGPPAQFGVLTDGRKQDLRSALQPTKTDGKTTYKASYKAKAPGDHVFFIEPAPYWEPAEEKLIIHYTKVVVNAFGEEDGWDAMVGFPVEIQPLVRPYGLWTGNIFRGIVKRAGKPVPYAEIEVEFLNSDGAVKAPADAFVTQVIKADGNGVFAYAMPRAGWWAFAALIDGERRKHQGTAVDVELGALIWVHCVDMK